MNTSAKSVNIAKGIYYRAAWMNLSDNDQSEYAKIVRTMWNKWMNDNTSHALAYVLNIQCTIFDDVNRNSELY